MDPTYMPAVAMVGYEDCVLNTSRLGKNRGVGRVRDRDKGGNGSWEAKWWDVC